MNIHAIHFIVSFHNHCIILAQQLTVEHVSFNCQLYVMYMQ